MTKDDKINIKVEVYKDKTSGKLGITAHFDTNAPNIITDKNDYSWFPTSEERDFINEAFQLVQPTGSVTPSRVSFSKPVEIEKERSIPEPIIEKELSTLPKSQPKEEEKRPVNLPPLEKQHDSDIFEVTDKDLKTDDFEKDIDKKTEEIPTKTDEPKSEDSENEKKEKDEGIIVEADSDAIEAALKKHTDNDDSIVEADEKTIIDKVLSQKKKGKWSRK